jgi:hypothetical protein
VRPVAAVILLAFLTATACRGGPAPEPVPDEAAHGHEAEPRTPAEAAARDASTDLSKVPLGAADYRLYANIMGGAGALGLALSVEDRALLDWLKKVDTGQLTPGPGDQDKLARARALQHKDDEMARIQGIEPRYRDVKTRIEALIGPNAKTPPPDDALSRQNLRFLEAYRPEIERLQKRVRDPLSREPLPQD